MMKNKDNYEDIINLPHPNSDKHPRMSLYDRAAQFAPFSALTGHKSAIDETARLTDEKLELDEYTILKLNEKIQIIKDNLYLFPLAEITYFIPDERKLGGKYISYVGNIKRIDEYEKILIMTDETIIPIEMISEIKGELFIKYQIYE